MENNELHSKHGRHEAMNLGKSASAERGKLRGRAGSRGNRRSHDPGYGCSGVAVDLVGSAAEAMNLASGCQAEGTLLLLGTERCVADNNDSGEGQCGWLEPTASFFTNRQTNNTLGRPVLGLETVTQRSQGLPLNEAM